MTSLIFEGEEPSCERKCKVDSIFVKEKKPANVNPVKLWIVLKWMKNPNNLIPSVSTVKWPVESFSGSTI